MAGPYRLGQFHPGAHRQAVRVRKAVGGDELLGRDVVLPRHAVQGVALLQGIEVGPRAAGSGVVAWETGYRSSSRRLTFIQKRILLSRNHGDCGGLRRGGLFLNPHRGAQGRRWRTLHFRNSTILILTAAGKGQQSGHTDEDQRLYRIPKRVCHFVLPQQRPASRTPDPFNRRRSSSNPKSHLRKSVRLPPAASVPNQFQLNRPRMADDTVYAPGGFRACLPTA